MRLIEALILVCCLLLLVWPLLRRTRPRWLDWLPLTAVLLLILHLIFEGYRWQMVPAYVLAAGLVIWALSGRKMPLIVGIGGLIWLVVAAALPVLLPVPRPLAPTGPYAVGTAVYHLTDSTRDEIYTDDPADKRELMVQVWYPAQPPQPGTKPVRYLEDIEVAGPAIARRLHLPAFLLDHLNLAYSQSFPEAAITAESEAFPVIIFSHGLNGFRNQNTTLVQELASYGYVVAAIDHTYANIFTVFPNGRVTFYEPAIFSDEPADPPRNSNTLVGVWAQDIAFVLDQMAGWQSEVGNRFNGRLDLNHIGVFGHSTGGGAAAEFCLIDRRCKAGLGLDAWVEPVSDDVLDGLPAPFMLIQADRWQSVPDHVNSTRARAIYEAGLTDSYLLIVTGAAHYDFTDLPLFSPLTPQLGLSSDIPSRHMATMLNAYALSFFDLHLKGKRSELLTGTAVYPEITFNHHP
jgi:predicted dienelactone hydrolase